MADLPLDRIQGFIMRTYAMPALRVFVLAVEHARAAGNAVATLVAGSSSRARR